MKKVFVDKEDCIGCGTCVALCDEVFALDDKGKATVKWEKEEEIPACVQEAIDSCPVNAIKSAD